MPLWSIIAICAVGACVIGTALFFLFRPKYIAYKYDEADRYLVSEFRRCNVLVFGKKGTGKDLIFAHVISLRGEKHYANIPYDYNTEVIELYEVAAGDNTFVDCVNGTVRPFTPRFEEGFDVYMSDLGIYFPSSLYVLLDKLYPSLPVDMALSRQLYNSNRHGNCQALERPWIKIREQADSYIQTLGTVEVGDYLFVHIRCYDTYENAKNEKNWVAEFNVRIPKSELMYDSRYFRNIFFENPPTTQDYLDNFLCR